MADDLSELNERIAREAAAQTTAEARNKGAGDPPPKPTKKSAEA